MKAFSQIYMCVILNKINGISFYVISVSGRFAVTQRDIFLMSIIISSDINYYYLFQPRKRLVSFVT